MTAENSYSGLNKNVYSDPNIIAMKAVYDKALYLMIKNLLSIDLKFTSRQLAGLSPMITQLAATKIIDEDIILCINHINCDNIEDSSYIYEGHVYVKNEVVVRCEIKNHELPVLLAAGSIVCDNFK